MIEANILCIRRPRPKERRISRVCGFEVVNSARVVVVAETEQRADFLLRAKTLPYRSGKLILAPAAGYRRIAAHAEQGYGRQIGGRLGHQVHRSANGIGILVGREGL